VCTPCHWPQLLQRRTCELGRIHSQAARFGRRWTAATQKAIATAGPGLDLDRAIGDYDEAIRLNPRDISVYTDRGNLEKVRAQQRQYPPVPM